MADVLIASDARWVVEEVTAALSSTDDTVREVTRGADVLPAVADHPAAGERGRERAVAV